MGARAGRAHRGGDWRPQRIGPVPSQYSVSARRDVERSILAACGVPVSLVIPSAGADAREGWRRFLWKLLAAVGVALMAYAWADEERFNQAELFGLGAGVRNGGILFWRDLPGPHAPGDNGLRRWAAVARGCNRGRTWRVLTDTSIITGVFL